MKTLRILITTFIATLALSSVGHALPPGKDGPLLPVLSKKNQFEALKPGDKLALICKASDTVMVIDIKDSKQAMALCKEGRIFTVRTARRTIRSPGLVQENPEGSR